MVAELAGRAVVTVPSTYMQSAPDFVGSGIRMRPDPPGFALHALRDRALSTHVQTISP